MAKESTRKRKCVIAVLKTMKWVFIVFCLYLASLFFREEHVPACLCNALIARFTPANLIVHCDEIGFGFRRGVHFRGLKVYDREKGVSAGPLAEADSISVFPVRRRLRVVGAHYPRLPDSYYAPGNAERNKRVEFTFPRLPKFSLILVRPDILSARPAQVEATVAVEPHRIVLSKIHLDWQEKTVRKGLDGFCSLDLDKQEILGEVGGLATQAQIRPMLEALDVPVAVKYMDNFTDVPEPVRAWCGWKVNLVNNDFDLSLEMHPVLGKYNGVSMRRADGRIRLHSYTRGTCLNYRTEVGPIESFDPKERPLRGEVVVTGTNNYNVVTVNANSALPLYQILRIGGFEGRYVDDEVIGETEGRLEFRFPRSMTNNYEVLNGEGHVQIRKGRLMRLRLFAGLTKQLADHVPGISYLVDQSQASVDYRIENGVIRTDNAYVEGQVFSIKMAGSYDTVKDDLDFTVRVLFTKKDSLMGRYFIHPVTWPFSKLLLEFKLKGSSTNPQWEYISILDRVLDILK